MAANIFGGIEPPRWLQDLTIPKEQGEVGSELGLALGAGLLALQPNEKGDHLKGYQQGLAEARMNQQDPNWKVKEQILEGQAVSNWAKAATEWQSYNASNKDMALWTTKDLPAISKFQEELKTNPDAVPPVVQSGKGLQVISQLEKQQMALQGMRLKQDNAKINLDNQKTSIAFDQAVSAAPVGIASAIDELPNQGWNLDKQGKRTSPSTAALRIFNDWATDSGKDPTKAFGYKPNAAEVAQIRNQGAVAAVQARGEESRKTEEARQENRKELEDLKQKGRIDIEKTKQLSRVDAGGKTITEKEFINRHFNTVWTTLRKNAPDDETPGMTGVKAEKLLSGVYNRVDARSSKPAVASPAATAQPATTTTNDADPLGILK